VPVLAPANDGRVLRAARESVPSLSLDARRGLRSRDPRRSCPRRAPSTSRYSLSGDSPGAHVDEAAPQHYCCGVLPEFDSTGALPPGIHSASWDEIVDRFAWTDYRAEILDGLFDALAALRAAGCQRAYLDGSFVTDKEVPGDYDLIWETTGVDLARLDPVFFDVKPPRAAQKARYRGDLLPNVVESGSGMPFVDFFQNNKLTGGRKGIVTINVKEVSA